MSTFQYQSTFDTTSFVEDRSSSILDTPHETPATSSDSGTEHSPAGDLASFVCHIAYLENQLRNDAGTIFFDADSEVFGSKVDIGQGASFRVQRAEWRRKFVDIQSSSENRWGRYVALKAVRPKVDDKAVDWRDVLLEVRALLHEPLRYHPNIVRLIGLGWGPSADSASIYPQLILEFSEIGSMEALQQDSAPLPFAIKQKLCYDVGRGLSILHACGIVHGDLTHRNVLIYKSKVTTPGLPFTAKLSDFGGSIMDMAINHKHSLRMSTWPYSAPELGKALTADGIKKTDVYSFGVLIWRTFLDCTNILQTFGLTGEKTPQAEDQVSELKRNEGFLVGAKRSIYAYAASKSVREEATLMILHTLESTVQRDPSVRDLARTQWILRGLSPGLRPNLSFPESGEFNFEPLRLKNILDWPQQERIVKEFKRAAVINPHEAPVELQPFMASFYLFQCYLTEFGVSFDAQELCHWLAKATEPDESGGIVYYAQAWLWRVCNAFGTRCPEPLSKLETYFRLSIMRGHRNCVSDGEKIIANLHDHDLEKKWRQILKDGQYVFRTMTSGLGMPYFANRKLRRPYDLDDLPELDRLIQEELGVDYGHCLKGNQATTAQDMSDSDNVPKPRNFESIFVNHIGHGLLHFAASLGNVQALRHLTSKYQVDIDIRDQTAHETPLVCACRGGHFESAMFLLEVGAIPNAGEFGIESPLSWLSSFGSQEMQKIAQKLVDAGAIVDGGGTHTLRPDVRPIWADWEHLMSISVTPLGRAVIMNNLEAVKVLLSHGANPLTSPDRKRSNSGENSVQLAAVLNVPEILEVLILYLNSKPDEQATIFDEGEMLQVAHKATITPFDTTSLQSRIVRHGPKYKAAMFNTLRLLRTNKEKYSSDWKLAGNPKAPGGSVLCMEAKLGNTDIVEHLIELGHSPNGSPGHRPLAEAVKHNQEPIFRVLIGQGANIFVKCSEDNGSQLSLLQICADRPKTARPGLFIAEYLLQKGVSVDPLQDGSPSALVFAMRNQDFKLANLLLANGADVNFTYQLGKDGPWMTILGELTQTHTVGSLKAIEYLLSLDNKTGVPERNTGAPENLLAQLDLKSSNDSRQAPGFIVDKTNNLSVFQILATCSQDTINNTAQLSARIIGTLLKYFKGPEYINFTHPVYGTALCLASITSNVHMVSALLEVKARTDISATPVGLPSQLKAKLGQTEEPAVPKNLALSVLSNLATEIHEATQPNDSRPLSPSSLAIIRDNITILEMLPGPDGVVDVAASALLGQLSQKIKELAKRSNTSRAAWTEGEGNMPVDLSVLKEFDELPWKEGEEMGSEQAIQTMLKYVR
ncbi:serine threonine-kinase receptor [Hyphodiscus hymeniophilus]|uniref:EKC/KEOPS complex subunit BUD32 n=1 Tax=Hyphodiscus hymeniophilus TaxID=353542 RepID=A0A9P6VPZ3_9HELO|nr:serine threonine-kinase receptor [Hyphodiscus hymeniophilus]